MATGTLHSVFFQIAIAVAVWIVSNASDLCTDGNTRVCSGGLQERKDVPEEEIAVWQAVAGGLQAVARQAAPALLDALLAWRREALGSATQLTSDPSAPPALLVHKKVIPSPSMWRRTSNLHRNFTVSHPLLASRI